MKKFLCVILALVMVLGMTVPAMAANVPTGYITDGNGIMAYRLADYNDIYGFGAYCGTYLTTVSIYGKYEGEWKDTTCGQNGFGTIVRIYKTGGTDFTDYPVRLDKLDGTGKCIIKDKDTGNELLSVAIVPKFANEGKTLQIEYIVKNISVSAVEYSIGSGGDIQIGSNDRATVIPIKEKVGSEEKFIGFKMLESDNGEEAQFNFLGANRTGATGVDGFWYGKYTNVYGSTEKNIFEDKAVKENLDDNTDSGCAWHWNGILEVGAEKNYSVLIGIGGAGSENIGGRFKIEGNSIILNQSDSNSGKITDFTNGTFTVTVNGVALADTDFTIENANSSTPKIVLTTTGMAKLTSGAVVEITAVVGNSTISGSVTVPNNAPATYTITKGAETNGNTFTVSSASATAGTTIAVTATPATGYEVDTISVVDAAGNTVSVNNNGEFTMPASNVTVNVSFKLKTYTVKYYIDGNVVDTQTVEHGSDATAPSIPAKYGYTQVDPRWDKVSTNITSNTDITAIYTINKYTVKFYAIGANIPDQIVEHGSDAVLPEIPARAGYYKERWDNDGKNIVEDTVIRAIYNKIPTAVVIDGTDVPERDEEAEVNPSTGAPVMNVLPAFAVICAAAFLGKRK